MEINDVLGEMHADRMRVTQTLQDKISEQRQLRQRASSQLIAILQAQISELRQQELLLLPEGGMPDVHRRDRQTLERERREKELSLAHEQIQALRDEQPTFTYNLHLTRELLEQEQHHERMHKSFYDVRPH